MQARGAAVALLALGLASTAAGAESVPEATAQDPRAHLQRMEEAVEAARALNAQRTAERIGLEDERARLDAALAEAAQRIRETEAGIAAADEDAAELAARRGLARRSLEERQAALAPALQALAGVARRPPPALLTPPEAAEDAARRAAVLAAIAERAAAEIAAVDRDLDALDALETEAAATRNALAQRRAALMRERETLDTLAAERASAAAAAEAAEAAARAELERLVTEAQSLGEILDLVLAGRDGALPRIAHVSGAGLPDEPGPPVRGALIPPAEGRIVTRFGRADPVHGENGGITFATAPGARVAAPADGHVIWAAPSRGWGHILIIKLPGEYHFVLTGLKSLAVAEDDFVLRGEPLGFMSGAEDARLYVEFFSGGRRVDPGPWFRADLRKAGE